MTSKRPLRGCNVFNDKWKDDPAFSEWLKPTANRAYAGCKVCGTNDISLSSLGRAALTSHAKVNIFLMYSHFKFSSKTWICFVFVGKKTPESNGIWKIKQCDQ